MSAKASSALTFVAKLRHCRKRISEWCSSSFYSISKTKKAIMDEILQLDILEKQHDLTPSQFEQRKLLKTHLKSVLVDEEVLWKARARQQWIKEGDGNTKFFHAVANGRRRANSIHEVVDEGRTLSREDDKLTYFHNKFRDIFAPADVPSQSVGDWSDFFATTPGLGQDHLTTPFSLEEIRKATF